MSKRQPTIEINDQIVAHDEIVEVIEIRHPRRADQRKTPNAIKSGIKLVDGSILPLPPQKVDRILDFLYQNEQ